MNKYNQTNKSYTYECSNGTMYNWDEEEGFTIPCSYCEEIVFYCHCCGEKLEWKVGGEE